MQVIVYGVALQPNAPKTDATSNINQAVAMQLMSSDAAAALHKRAHGDSTVIAMIPTFEMHHNHDTWNKTLGIWMDTADIQDIATYPMFASHGNDLRAGRSSNVVNNAVATFQSNTFWNSRLKLHKARSSLASFTPTSDSSHLVSWHLLLGHS